MINGSIDLVAGETHPFRIECKRCLHPVWPNGLVQKEYQMLAAARAPDPRADTRSNVFLSAVLTADRESRAVRVRNLSTRGALVDGPGLPPVGTEVCLVRGDLRAAGEVAWVRDNECGVRFRATVVVNDWVRKVGHSGQQRVDETIAFIRAKTAERPGKPLLIHERDSVNVICTELEGLSIRLASDPDLVCRHASDLILLDAIAQRLRQLATRS